MSIVIEFIVVFAIVSSFFLVRDAVRFLYRYARNKHTV